MGPPPAMILVLVTLLVVLYMAYWFRLLEHRGASARAKACARGRNRARTSYDAEYFDEEGLRVRKFFSTEIFLFKNVIHWVLSGFRAQKTHFGTL